MNNVPKNLGWSLRSTQISACFRLILYVQCRPNADLPFFVAVCKKYFQEAFKRNYR